MPGTPDRPVYLNLLQIRLPVAGIMSIVHRISGVLMFLATPALIFLLDLSLSSAHGFAKAGTLVHSDLGWLILFGMVWGLLHHLLAGIRYLLLDVHIGVDKPWYRYSAWAVLISAPLLAVALTGVLL
jgi:succinate dehydrogenase / fumarate reductase cytochrome b subunit